MIPFEALYGKKCHTLLSLSHTEDKLILLRDALQEMERIVKIIQQNIQKSQDIQNSYADKKRIHREFKMGHHVYLNIKPKKEYFIYW